MSEFLAEAQVLVVPNTAAFAASLRTQLAAAVVAAGPVVIPITAAPLAGGVGKAVAAETAVATTAVNAQTAALQREGAAATRTAFAQAELATATRASALAHSQAARGIAAETLALTGLRGATLAASAPFLLGATAAIIFAKSIKEASNETEQLNKSREIFGQSASAVEEFSRTTAVSLGISADAALEATGIFGNLFRAIHIGEPAAAAMSTRLVQLASDLSSFNNASPERTLEALRAGLVGQARPLRQFGVFLSAARVQQEALLETGKKQVKQITDADKVQARFNIILRDTVIAQGDFERTSDRLANQSRILSAQITNVSAAIGRQLLPVLVLAVQDVNLLIQSFERLSAIRINIPGTEKGGTLDALKGRLTDIFGDRVSKNLALNILFPGLGFNINNLELLNTALKKIVGSEEDATKATQGFNDALDAGARAARLAAYAIVQAQVAIKDIGAELRGLEIERLKIQTDLAPGGRAAEEANLRQQIADDKKAVALAKSGTAARKQALLDLKSDQDELASLLSQDAADARNRAQKIKDAATQQEQAAREVAQAQTEATQAFIDQFSGKQERLQNRLTSAQLFGSAQQQIALNKKIVAADKAEIEAIKDRIRHLHLHGAALRLAKDTIAALNQEIFNTRNAILQLQADRKQALVDARQSHLEAQLAIAETTSSTRDDSAAEKALIKFDQVQIRRILAIKRRRRLTLEEAAQLDAYRVDLAQRNQALKDVKQETEDSGKRFKEFLFSQLQAQQGFASNLLGNLITGSTAGLVGVPAPAPPRPQDVGAGVRGEANRAEGRANLGPTAGQHNAEISVLEKILIQMRILNGSYDAPEAINQKKSGGASMDYATM